VVGHTSRLQRTSKGSVKEPKPLLEKQAEYTGNMGAQNSCLNVIPIRVKKIKQKNARLEG
jgi:hypothetical protein